MFSFFLILHLILSVAVSLLFSWSYSFICCSFFYSLSDSLIHCFILLLSFFHIALLEVWIISLILVFFSLSLIRSLSLSLSLVSFSFLKITELVIHIYITWRDWPFFLSFMPWKATDSINIPLVLFKFSNKKFLVWSLLWFRF